MWWKKKGPKQKNLTFVVVMNQKEMARILTRLDIEGYDVSKCQVCGEPIYNRTVVRQPKNWYERVLSKLGVVYTEWQTNMATHNHDTKGVLCNSPGCVLRGL